MDCCRLHAKKTDDKLMILAFLTGHATHNPYAVCGLVLRYILKMVLFVIVVETIIMKPNLEQKCPLQIIHKVID